MSYRSITRVLGETSLERKIRILFGVALLVLIGGAFFLVSSITETFIRENTHRKAEEFASIYLLKTHYGQVDYGNELTDAEEEFKRVINESIRPTIHDTKLLVLDAENKRYQTNPGVTNDPAEREFLERLASSLRDTQLQLDEEHRNPKEKGAKTESSYIKILQEFKESDQRFDRIIGESYLFYEPVLFSGKCIVCHNTLKLDSSENSNEFQGVKSEHQTAPIYFLRVALPYAEAKSTIIRTRSILMAVAILTAFVSMVALYLIVRYVIVKPLKHLRDVSDEVSHGDLEVRSELNTGDEFEELSTSFNKMLRHLSDAQSQLSLAKSHLENKVNEQAQLNLKLHEMNRVKSEFLANMSHELRTPLNSIIGFSEVLESARSLDDKQQGYAKKIRSAGRALLELINDILDLAKLEAGKFDVSPGEVDIRLIVGELCDMVRPMAEEKRIEIQAKIPNDFPTVFSDHIKIRQIATNLVSNAVKFTPDGGRVTVSAHPKGVDCFQLVVTDTGVGIPAEDQEIVFEKFRQGGSMTGENNLTREFAGTGLGLSIVRELCHLLGGTVTLESEVGKGSIFSVTLPLNYQTAGRSPLVADQEGQGAAYLLPVPEKMQIAHDAVMNRTADSEIN